MDVGIGLPNAVPGTSGAQLVEWARRADGRGFSSLGTIDRIVYDNYEVLTALAAAAAVTEPSLAVASKARSADKGGRRRRGGLLGALCSRIGQNFSISRPASSI